MGRLKAFGFGSFFTILVALFIFYYSRKEGWTIVKWVSGIYLVLTVGIFVLILAIALIFLLVLLIINIVKRIKNGSHKKEAWQKKKEAKEEGTDVIDANFVEYKEEKTE